MLKSGKHIFWLITLLVCLHTILISSCKINYSFTGASISPDIKTITIKNFPNYASLASPSVSQKFTEALRDVFTTQTNLNFVSAGGDVQLEGSITNYNTVPVAVQGNQIAASNRLSVTVHAKFTNNKDEKQDFETDFTRYADFASDKNLASVEDQLLKEINNQLAQDIFNKAFTNW